VFIALENVSKAYGEGEGRTQALKGVSLSLDAGEIGVILGPSGSGKSTLMNIIGGVDRSQAGKVEVDGVDLAGLSDSQLTEYRREKVSFVFQFYNLVANLTAAENIEVVSNIARNPIELESTLRAVGMWEKRRSFPRQLSGGEQQRVAIARAIVKNPKLMLCDEPTGALDYATSLEVLSLIQMLNKTYSTTVLMITHNEAIAEMANAVFRLRSGEITHTAHNPSPSDAAKIVW